MLLRRLFDHGARNRGDLVALLLDRCSKLRRRTASSDRAYLDQSLVDGGIGRYLLNIRGDALAKLRRHVKPAEEASDGIEREIGIAGLSYRRYFGCKGSTLTIDERQQSDLSSLRMRTKRGHARC